MGFFSRKSAPKPEEKQAPPAPEPSAPAAGGSAEAILANLRAFVVKLSEGRVTAEAIDPKGHIFDYGYVDSFKSAELLAFIHKQYGVEIPEVHLVGRLNTLDALARHIQGQAAQ